MSNIGKALIWALVLLIIAAGKRNGMIDAKAADTLFIVVPIVALLSLGGGCRCRQKAAR
jgi:hypothetical protein